VQRHSLGRWIVPDLEMLLRVAPASPADWDLHAACQGVDTERFYATSDAAVERAKGICGRCFVQADCLAAADECERGLGRKMVHGIWGGLTADERIERRLAEGADCAAASAAEAH
jgi:Transcription factor WhiB